jgi:Lrp/AsnC family transcriptional regulator, leucine-responsive regulatory protein
LKGDTALSAEVELDEIDAKIIKALLKDARTSLKDIAEDCGLSSNAIHKRIHNLKASGVIAGATTLFNPKIFGNRFAICMEITVDYDKKDDIVEFVREHPDVVMCIEGIGRCDILAFMTVKDVNALDLVKEAIRKQPGVKRVTTVIRLEEIQFLFENLDLLGGKTNGRNRPSYNG